MTFGILLSSCEPVDDADKYEEKVVVFGNLKANEWMMDTIYVSRSYDINQAHEAEANWITDAVVSIGTGSRVYPFESDPNHPGRYIVGHRAGQIQPNETFELSVESGLLYVLQCISQDGLDQTQKDILVILSR